MSADARRGFSQSAFVKLMLAVVLSLAASAAMAAEAYGATLFTYKGTGIQNLASKNDKQITKGKTCYVKHSQKPDAPNAVYGMKVSIQRHNGWLSWDTVHSKTFYKTVTGNKSLRGYCEPGKYRLYFKTMTGWKMSISGAFCY